MRPAKPPPLRPYLCDRVHAALVRAGRPVTRGELRMLMVNGTMFKSADMQAALDVLVKEGLARKSEERGQGSQSWRRFEVYRAVGEGE